MAALSNKFKEKNTPKSGTSGDTKGQDLDIIRKNLAKRSFHVKFDLDNTGYQPIEKIGIGAYGVVCSAVDKESSDRVAIKKIPYVFEALAIAKRTYREIKILKHFKHDNIISIREILKPKESYPDFKDIYVVFDLMESDLHRIIYSEQPLTEEHIRYFLYQILRGLKYIHSANVVHRDLKPSNLLVNEDCHVRIGDFGMARGVNSQPEEPSHYMTQYVATRWYRAPEILLSLLEYGTAVDMWSVGCIFAEMLGRKHLFPGKDYLTQVKLVLGLLGTPSESVLKNCQSDVLRRIIRSLGHRAPMSWMTLFPKASKKALDFLGKMLVINPADRITVEKALKHPFLSKYHDPDDEPICVPSFEFDFEKELLHMDSEHLREVIYKEIMEFHQPRTPTLSFLACLRPAPKTEGASEVGVEEGDGVSPSLKDQLQAMMSSMTTKAERKGEDLVVKPSGSSVSTIHENSRPPTEDPPTNQILGQRPPAQPPLPLDREVFKTPSDKAATKKSPVSVETSNLQLPSGLSDVEMLSAQSTDGSKAMDTHMPRLSGPDKQEKETKASEKKGTENKTISEDTKALVKQALLSHRQRTESCGDDDKPRPVTAAQRQREREEKRKKKRDSRMKKMHEKKKEVPQATQLSDADKELLARWSSMQKKEMLQTLQPPAITASSQSTPVATIVYLHQANPTTPSPPQVPQGLSPPHPPPTSTPPSILPAGMIPQGLVAGQMAMGSLTASQGQVILPHTNLPQTMGLQGQTTLQQGHVTLPQQQQQGAQTMLTDAHVIPLEDLHRHVGGQLQITHTQAEALKEALNLSPTSVVNAERRSSGGGGGDPAAGILPVHTPPQATHDPAGFSPTADLTRSPLHTSTSPPSLGQQAAAHSPLHFSPPGSGSGQLPDMLFGQSPVSRTSPFQTNFAQGASHTEGSSHPQNLAEFLERHCQKSEQENAGVRRVSSETFPAESLASGHEAASNDLDKLKNEEQQGFPSSCQYFSNQVKPESEFANEALAVPGSMQSGSHVHSGVNPNPAAGFQNAMFPAGSSAASICYSMQQQPPTSVPGPNAPSFFMPSEGGMTFGPTAVQANAGNLPFTSQGAVDASSHVALPFSRYTEATPDFQMLGSREGGSFGVGSHPAVPPHGALPPHPGMTQVTVAAAAVSSHSHPGLGQVSGGSHPGLSQASLSPHQTPAPPPHHPASGLVPSDGYSQQADFHTPHPMQTSASSHSVAHPHANLLHLHHHHHHHQHHHAAPAPHLNPDPADPDPARQGERSRGPGELRVSAPKQGDVDLVAMLSSKLSSIFPPSLSLTPRGTGAGYGVGMDLDVLMADAADNAGRGAELSPLSSSLLADWLDLSQNISQADLDALEQDFGMTSPMAMSYTDFHTGPSGNDNNAHWG